MDVKVETVVATSATNPGRKVRPKLWRVRVDGLHAGFIGWKPGSKLLMYLRFSPEEMKEIEKKVGQQIALLNEVDEKEVQSVVPAEVPEGIFNDSDEEFDEYDFDPDDAT